MENFNKNSLKAAAGKYGPLHSVDKKTDSDVKAEIGKDDRKFTVEQINEIYAAILNPELLNPEPEKPKNVKHVVKTAFRDINDFSKEYAVGQDVSKLEPSRLETLVANGHVEKVEED